MNVGLIITGGTLDKDYDPITGELTFPGSCVPEMLAQARVTVPLTTTVLMQKDSLEMNTADRRALCDACAAHAAHRLVITHGTDTMVESAHALAQDARLKEKTIVLTGAMRPFRLGRSDALFNVGAAIMAAQLATSGVWVAMQGALYPWHGVRKDRAAGYFVTSP